jgi:oligopeptide transport system ATP-binding protein
VDFNLHEGEALGIVGESGCGKSTLARALVGLSPVTSGSLDLQGCNLATLDAVGWRAQRRAIQRVFQDATASLDPRMTVSQALAEPLRSLVPELGHSERDQRVARVLDRVGLSGSLACRYPHQLSGGQCQRVAIARAIVVEPKILVCDEPVSALDMSVRAQIVNLLADLRDQGMAMIFIAHDLALVDHLCSRTLVMVLGRFIEQGPSHRLFREPAHPYSRALLACVPSGDPDHRLAALPDTLEHEPPGAILPIQGCVFSSRCPIADERCFREPPHQRPVGHGGHAACHYVAGARPT